MDATRRQALAGAAALALAGALPRSLSALGSRTVRPGRLRPGDTVGLVNPAGAVWEPVNIEIVTESLAALGFKARLGKNLLARRGYFAGTDEQRADDLNAMFAPTTCPIGTAASSSWKTWKRRPTGSTACSPSSASQASCRKPAP